MNEQEILRIWHRDDKIVVIGDDLRSTLLLLAKNGFKAVIVQYLGGEGFGIAKLY